MRGAGRVVFAATLLLIVDNANVFVNDTRYILTNLNTLGWVLIVLGVVQLTGGFSLISGNTYGRVIGIMWDGLGAIGALLSIGGSYPWWSLGIFALCVYVMHGLFIYGDDEGVVETDMEAARRAEVERAMDEERGMKPVS